jgi:4-hydroxythreonine-4-phosphate dehydrogenase
MIYRDSLKIGITLGDPAGIGPEVALKSLGNSGLNKNIIPVLIGREEILSKLYSPLFKNYIQTDFSTELVSGRKYIYNVGSDFTIPQKGRGDINTGRESLDYIDSAISLWKEKKIDALVTGPVSKELIEKSGTGFSGHTEYIAEKINEPEPYMMMYSDFFRVLLVSTHIPISEVSRYAKYEKILKTILTGYKYIKAIDNKEPKIAIAGLDPHCGDGGAISSFDSDVTVRAVNDARTKGIDIEGPISADSLFRQDVWKKFNLVIAHYHDQGLIPFKMLSFNDGVNVTLGLSITRTSVDHGTAFDKAGKDSAGYESMTNAINLCYKLETGRRMLS